MGIRFSKSIKVGNLLKLNISKSGISATVGKKGASINLGKKGAYLNLSPSAVGLKGTGVSYRQKLFGGHNSLLDLVKGKKKEEKQDIKDNKNDDINLDEIEEYEARCEATFNAHKYTRNVLSKKEFAEKINDLQSDASKQVYQAAIDGDEDTIESLIGGVVSNLDLTYEANANYELEDHDLYVDIDLPEIEVLDSEYPVLEKDKIVKKNKTQAELKKDYADLVLSIGVYLTANFFNESSYIDRIIISGFTTKRNNAGDLKDEYLYSVKFTRDVFEKTELSKVDNLYDFILKFENRINLNISNNTFKAIEPYEMPSVAKANSIIEDAIAGLKELGYKNTVINAIIPELNKLEFASSSEYLKAALKLISELKN